MSKRVLIVGLGLLGGSYALALKEKGYHITAIDCNQDSIDYALSQDIIEAGSSQVSPALLSACDIVVLGMYPKQIAPWLQEHQEHFAPGTVITDVCGVKTHLVAELEELLREDLHYVGAHPMAGKEVSGVRFADGKMFQKANFILCPTQNSKPNAVALIRQMAEDMGFRQISTLSPQEHDKAIGFLSQLTHVIAVSLMNCQENEDYAKYTGDSFRDLTRIASINEHLWSELFLCNQEILLEEIDGFVKELQDFRQILAEGNEQAMKEKCILSTQRKKKF